MARTKPSLIAFNRGEVGAHTLARIDLENYERGAEIVENIIPLIQGGMEKAPGTDFVKVANASGADGRVLLRPFIFSQTENYLLEMSENEMLFLFRGEGALVANAPSGVIGTWSDESGGVSTGGAPPPPGGNTQNTGGGGGSTGTGGGGFTGGGTGGAGRNEIQPTELE